MVGKPRNMANSSYTYYYYRFAFVTWLGILFSYKGKAIFDCLLHILNSILPRLSPHHLYFSSEWEDSLGTRLYINCGLINSWLHVSNQTIKQTKAVGICNQLLVGTPENKARNCIVALSMNNKLYKCLWKAHVNFSSTVFGQEEGTVSIHMSMLNVA